MTMIVEPPVGSRVITADGKELGIVKRIEEVAFEIDVPGAPDFWLKKDEIAGIDGAEVHMSFDSDDLEDHAIRYGDV